MKIKHLFRSVKRKLSSNSKHSKIYKGVMSRATSRRRRNYKMAGLNNRMAKRRAFTTKLR